MIRLVGPDERAPAATGEVAILTAMAEELAELSRAAECLAARAAMWRAWALDRAAANSRPA